MRIIVGQATEEAMAVLGLEQYPFTTTDLKTCFRSSAKLYHKDKGGSDEKMRKVLEAYKILQHLPIDVVEVGITPIEEVEADMFDMFEDKECFDCSGTGKRRIFEDVSGYTCLKCKGSGKARLKCKFCKSGKFTLRNGRIVDCRACTGTGIFAPVCNMCDGNGYVESTDYSFYGIRDFFRHFRHREPKYREKVCSACKGKGMIRTKLNPFNPVIPKGAVL